ncbi:hypothetical protein A3742_01525 [Oleiphilus sp. HI0071]|jgi:type IV pilus assembly protein PilF|uniref:type IV pilus biogenesis/stability protein PilW n=2 Tax=unclassified Oleiphilus TaxID=2631174 RepID=UPI0007C38CD0|nr:type IV pilus biogenesis/stability protein PilW [Oleiphilus sp. HI0079]KZY72939.1 hypothetical protein A3737_27680 [Oleiphilus sp. HI0065]KZY82051.1 hypothetical protein A3742_01525 [Oleiphilus sp. HI0071]KZY91181.1 hypothetical protein A3744_04780 [Oleiphilus sp. HI0073]KZZ41532.1 hypothetical protein A3758_22715 [Oleiphilus sp. HI0118]KZZ60350.1 hypothetical protein A3760_05645 [Oleiphilus sp. HI0122]KZZ71584.1 hypothetical protein A3765_13850 [Oleiphilus sp. HI0130]KZZ82008.1 hypotheti
MLLKRSNFILITSFLLALTGCVTTSDSSLSRNADPEVAIARYVDLGFEYIKREDFTRARKHLDRALELDEDNPAANSALGLIFSRQGEYKLAEESFETALSSDPTYTRGRTYYGALLFSQQRFEEALEQFVRAAEDTTYNARSQVYTNIALCHLRLGSTSKAEYAYERSLQLDRFNAGSLAGITEVLLKLNEYKRAQYYYNRLIKQIASQALSHSPQTLWQGVRIAKHFNAHDQAQSLANLLQEQYPDSPEYQNYLSQYGG